jgi:GNAT superfamily N-acetyltransferase
VEIRPATEADFDAELAVMAAAQGALRRRHAFPWTPPTREAFAATHAHLLATDPGRSWVAEEGGRLVGYSAAFTRGDVWFLADLFVDPGHQAAGVGTRLLERAWGDGELRRMTLTDAIQPISNALYGRRGLVPSTPVLELGGPAGEVPPSGLEPREPDARTLAVLDAAAYGFDRVADHAFWSGHARCTVWGRAGEPVAYSYAGPGARIGPVAGTDGSAAAGALAGELARLNGRPAALDVPGSSRELVELALAAGLRITGPPGFLLLGRGLAPPRALALGGYWLF